jgi:hypothetical protein
MLPSTPAPRPPASPSPRRLAHELVDSLGRRSATAGWAPARSCRRGRLHGGVPGQPQRRPRGHLAPADRRLVETRHGVGTFVVGAREGGAFRIGRAQLATLQDVIAMLELRIGVEVEAAGLAAQRRSAENLDRMRAALDAFTAALEAGRDAVSADFQFHLEIMRATQNQHFAKLLMTLGRP